MRRRRVVLTVEVETVLTVKELLELQAMRFGLPENSLYLTGNAVDEEQGLSLGTIQQVQVNVIRGGAPMACKGKKKGKGR